jgi:anti-anti-sigma regulatory factor
MEWTAVILRGELDLAATQELLRRVRVELAREKPVLVELTGLEFSDLNGIRALLSLVREGERRAPPAEVELHGAGGQVRRMLQRFDAASTKRAE